MSGTMVCTNPDCPDVELYGVHGEYGPEARTCPKCHHLLVPLDAVDQDRSAPAEPGGNEPAPLVPLCAPRTSAELAVVRSLLQAEGISHFVHNEHFGALEVGPFIPLLNVRTVLVPADELDRARGLLVPTEPAEGPAPSYAWTDRLRVLLEGILLGWVIPNRRPVIPSVDRRDHQQQNSG